MEGGDEEQAPFERVELGAAFADADVSPFLPRASLSQRALCTACASHRSVRSHPPDAAQRRTTGATCAAALPSSSLAHFAGAASPPLLRSCVATTSAIGARPDRFALLAHRRCPLSALLQLAVPPPPGHLAVLVITLACAPAAAQESLRSPFLLPSGSDRGRRPSLQRAAPRRLLISSPTSRSAFCSTSIASGAAQRLSAS